MYLFARLILCAHSIMKVAGAVILLHFEANAQKRIALYVCTLFLLGTGIKKNTFHKKVNPQSSYFLDI